MTLVEHLESVKMTCNTQLTSLEDNS